MIKIYTTEYCNQCFQLKNLLGKYEVDFEEIKLTKDNNQYQVFKKLGITSFPIVTSQDNSVIVYGDVAIKYYLALLSNLPKSQLEVYRKAINEQQDRLRTANFNA